jgi:hypothetical protein
MTFIRVNERPRIAGNRVWIDQSVLDIDRRIKEGDESGWRGDPSMFLMFNPATDLFEVWGIDRGGNQYMACSHHQCDHILLQKLVAGDPTKNDVVGKVLEANERLQKDREDAEKDKRMEAHDKLAHAIRQDFGAHLGGRKLSHGMYDGKKKEGG